MKLAKLRRDTDRVKVVNERIRKVAQGTRSTTAEEPTTPEDCTSMFRAVSVLIEEQLALLEKKNRETTEWQSSKGARTRERTCGYTTFGHEGKPARGGNKTPRKPLENRGPSRHVISRTIGNSKTWEEDRQKTSASNVACENNDDQETGSGPTVTTEG